MKVVHEVFLKGKDQDAIWLKLLYTKASKPYHRIVVSYLSKTGVLHDIRHFGPFLDSYSAIERLGELEYEYASRGYSAAKEVEEKPKKKKEELRKVCVGEL